MALTSVLPFQAGYFACSASHAAGAARARPARLNATRHPPPIARLGARVLERPADPVLSPVLPPVLSWKLRKFSNRFPSIMGTDSSVAAEQARSAGVTCPKG